MAKSADRQCGSQSYGMDQACLEFLSSASNGFELWTQSSECQGCDYNLVVPNLMNGSSVIVNATYKTLIKVSSTSPNFGCNLFYNFVDEGFYRMNVDKCSIDVVHDPGSPYWPIFYAFLTFSICILMCGSVNMIYNSRHCRRRLVNYYMEWRSRQTSTDGLLVNQDFSDEIFRVEDSNSSGRQIVASPPAFTNPPDMGDLIKKKESRRVRSLDTFRGLAVAVMVFVNYGGGGYWFFNHSPWNGLTVADLVFPWFMWIMGVSMPISFQSQLRNSTPRHRVIFRVVRRSITLFILGLMINSIGGNNDFRTFRIPGVLQRFGVAYLLTGTVLAMFLPRETPNLDYQSRWLAFKSTVLDVTLCIPTWVMALAMIGLHSLLTFCLPVPGCPTGYLGPGGLHEGGKYSNCTGGSAGYIDRMVLGDNHIYHWPTAKQVYNTNVPYDPEGILGCLTAAAIVSLGIQAGITLLTHQNWAARCKRWIFWFFYLTIIGGALCGFSKENGIIPVNKNLWSVSFIFVLAGMAFFLLTLMYLAVDVYGLWSGAPLIYVGMNPILVYMGHEICADMFPFSWTPYTSSHYEKLAMNLSGMSLWLIIAFILYKKKLFFSV